MFPTSGITLLHNNHLALSDQKCILVSFFDKVKQSSFWDFRGRFRVEGVGLEQKVTYMTPIEIRFYHRGKIFSPFYQV